MTPVLIAEGVAGERRTAPWLRTSGLIVTFLLFVTGCVSTASFSLQASPFVASRLQFIAVGLLTLFAIACAILVPAELASDVRRDAPRPVVVFAASLALSAAFMFAEDRGNPNIPPLASLLLRAGLIGAAGFWLLRWSAARDWRPPHYLAIACGTTMTYAVYGAMVFLRGRTNLGKPADAVDVVGQVVLAALVFLAIKWGADNRRL